MTKPKTTELNRFDKWAEKRWLDTGEPSNRLRWEIKQFIAKNFVPKEEIKEARSGFIDLVFKLREQGNYQTANKIIKLIKKLK